VQYTLSREFHEFADISICGRFLWTNPFFEQNPRGKMAKKPLCIALLWHMHQPDYADAQTGEICLPWTRLHAAKDYYDMGALVAEVPGLHLTINVVPSLMDQLAAYGNRTARETYAALAAKNAAELNEREKDFLLRAFFQLPWKQMVLPYSRYKDLLDKRGQPDVQGGFESAARRYALRDYRDLEGWFNLRWCGRELRRDPEVALLFRKGQDFTEAEKLRLLQIQSEFAGRVLPLYRRLMENQGIELSVSPYYHPILPLLCDLHSAREAIPGIPLPSNPFFFPDDAREHLQRARKSYQELFGRLPQGMWPSEGSISNAALDLIRENGLRWLASDEGVLWNSLQREHPSAGSLSAKARYSAHLWGEGSDGPCLFFRDHALSDLIGFTYCNWPSAQAAADFIGRLREIHQMLPDDGRHYVVPIILDGENAWEHYPHNGTEFLSLLYRSLTESADLRTVTFSEFLALEPGRESIRSVVAGSWIYGNLATWIGHAEKNGAWEALAAARLLLNSRRSVESQSAEHAKAFREIMIAEGSDWFWWYGDDHQSENAAEFDSLFRKHLKSVYELLGEAYPSNLDNPIKKLDSGSRFRNPQRTITPTIDGKVTSYFEWLPAGIAIPGAGESMHRTDRFLEKVFFGYDLRRFYLRLDLAQTKHAAFHPQHRIHIRFEVPREYELILERDTQKEWSCRTPSSERTDLIPDFAGGRILEIGIPLEVLGVSKPEETRIVISILHEGREVERFPVAGYLTVSVDPWGLDQQEWMV
jgi:alpha-amylase/alpha-mannosidase (GH57 family)